MKTFLVRGVPNAVQMDSWWMNEPPSPRAPTRRSGDAPALPNIAALIALVIAGDTLTWQAEAGLSLALFGMLILLTLWLLTGRKGWGGLVLGAAMFAPLVEQAQALSLGFFAGGLVLGAVWIVLGGWPGLSPWLGAALRFLTAAPRATLTEVRTGAGAILSQRPNASGQDLMTSWMLPIGFGLVFAALLISANPMLKSWLSDATSPRWITDIVVLRLLFWGGLALIILPFILAPHLREQLKLGFRPRVALAAPAAFNAASITRSLILFNVMFAVQTALDLTYLWGGAALPEGLSYASYAHRGAYPLLATALLAGLFALLARPFTDGSRALRLALLAWVGQNVFLVLSSLLRLELYVGAYGLTHLRLAALIWMIVVALGLCLVIVQVIRSKPACWLLTRAALLGVAALYASSFLSFSATIAEHNLSKEYVLDPGYVCSLGPHALPAVYAYEARVGHRLCAGPKITSIEYADWREWGFRDWRLQRSLEALAAKDETHG